MQDVLDSGLERLRSERFLHGANADFQALKRDPKATCSTILCWLSKGLVQFAAARKETKT
jgi:hypothetical protein